jgi:hypothetical protein
MPITADEAAVKKALDDLIDAILVADKARLEAGVVGDLVRGGEGSPHCPLSLEMLHSA